MDEDGESADILSTDQFGIPEYRELIVPELGKSNQQDQNGSRLMIIKIVNENFKSYAGIRQLGPFHKNFTAIIGPNGSGKSNVIDSMLFVFGYRANKIRSKKISVLIHNSEERQDIDSCTVSVYFQKITDEGPGDNEYRVVEDSQFVVSRTAFKDSSSYYKINNRKVHYREVETFLKNVGVDLIHNRFLILQGEVEQIAMMKPKSQNKNEDGMLEFLEDIIGSNRFKTPIETLSKRIEYLAELKNEKHNRVKTVENEKNELEGDKNEALEYLGIQNNIIRNKNLIFHSKLFDNEKTIHEISEAKKVITDELKEFDEKTEKIVSEKKSKAKEYKEAIKRYNNLTKEYDRHKEEFTKFEEDDTRCLEDMKHCKIKAKKLEASLQQEEKKLKEFAMIPEKQEKDLEDLKRRLGKLEKERKLEQENFNEVMSSFQDETKDLQAEKTKKETELLEVQKDVNEAKHKYQVTQTELDLFKSNQSKESNKLNDIRRNMDRVQNTLKEKKIVFEDLRTKVPESSTALDKCKKDLDKLNHAEQLKQEDVKQLRVKVEMARSNFQASQNQNKVLEYIMNLKKTGRIPGVYGRLGDLGAIDAKYDVAISTACGYLDYIIVDNMDTAQKCIEALKTGNIGQASFIGLDHMAKWREFCNKKINTPENVPRLFDLIKVNNPDVMPAFYFALRDTLVSKDINEATRIAYGATRFRVVTLGGQLIDLSGTMSGGGTRVIKGKMGSHIVEEFDQTVFHKMEKDLEKGSMELDGFRESRYKLQESISNFQKTHREVNNAFQKINNEIKSLEEQYDNYKAQIKEQELIVKQSAPDDKKLLALEKKVDQLKEAYEKIQKIASDMQDEIHEIHKQIMEIGGKQLKSIETKMALLDTQIDQINNTINKTSVAITTAQRNGKKSEMKVESLKQEIQENKEKMEQLEAEKQKIETEAHGLLVFLNKAEEDMKNHESEVAKVTEIISKYEDEEQVIKTQMIKVKHRFEKLELDEREVTNQIEAIKNEISKLKLNEIDEKEVETLQHYKTPEEMGDVDVEHLNTENNNADMKLSGMKPNMAAIDEYRRKNEIYLKRVDEMTRVSNLKDQQRKLLEEFSKHRLNEFMIGFGLVTNKLKEMYQMITLGGDAELELVDSVNPFAEGIVFSVRPPKKSWKNISNLSGGEKTLSSLALVFALHHYKPTPFYVMDEIDAALDFRNVSIVANYIKDRTENAQFIVISLRNNMFEQCDRLVGIFKVNNCTDSVIICPREIATMNNTVLCFQQL